TVLPTGLLLELVRVVQLRRVLDLHITNLGNPLDEVVRDARHDVAPLVPEAAAQPDDDDGALDLHQIHRAGDPDLLAVRRVAEDGGHVLARALEHLLDVLITQIHLLDGVSRCVWPRRDARCEASDNCGEHEQPESHHHGCTILIALQS
ncbi:unnamed protein product, partial [Pelagomonas calceolata]